MLGANLSLPPSSLAQSAAAQRQPSVEGDTAWAVVNDVKPGKRQQFEWFVS